MSLAALLQAVAGALQGLVVEIPELTIYPGWWDVPTPPAVDIYPGNPFQTSAGFGAGNQVFLTVRARVGMSDPTASQLLLMRLLDPTDVASVEAALKPIDVAVTDGGISGFTQYLDDAPLNERMLGCEWRVTTFL